MKNIQVSVVYPVFVSLEIDETRKDDTDYKDEIKDRIEEAANEAITDRVNPIIQSCEDWPEIVD